MSKLTPMINANSSLRIDLIRFPLIIFVVFIHAYKSKIAFSGGGVQLGIVDTNFTVNFIRDLISGVFAQLAVPIFFLLSGYLFFTGFNWSFNNYLIKLRKRVKTLLIPFLFWSFAIVAIYALVQAIPATRIFLSGESPTIANFGFFDYLNELLGYKRPQLAFQFWFIRDLIILALISPIINIIARYPILLLPFAYCWFINFGPIILPESTSIFFFSIGAYLAKSKKDLFFLDNYGLISVFIYLILSIIDAINMEQMHNAYLHNTATLFGILAFFYISKLIPNYEPIKRILLQLSRTSFFVFCIHEPTLTIIRKIFYKQFPPDSQYDILLLYFLIPAVTIALSISIFYILLNFFPRFLGLITGDRY